MSDEQNGHTNAKHDRFDDDEETKEELELRLSTHTNKRQKIDENVVLKDATTSAKKEAEFLGASVIPKLPLNKIEGEEIRKLPNDEVLEEKYGELSAKCETNPNANDEGVVHDHEEYFILKCAGGKQKTVRGEEAKLVKKRCDFFRNVFSHGTREAITNIIYKPDWSIDVATSVVELCTTGKTHIPADVLSYQNLLQVADQIFLPICVRHPADVLVASAPGIGNNNDNDNESDNDDDDDNDNNNNGNQMVNNEPHCKDITKEFSLIQLVLRTWKTRKNTFILSIRNNGNEEYYYRRLCRVWKRLTNQGIAIVNETGFWVHLIQSSSRNNDYQRQQQDQRQDQHQDQHQQQHQQQQQLALGQEQQCQPRNHRFAVAYSVPLYIALYHTCTLLYLSQFNKTNTTSLVSHMKAQNKLDLRLRLYIGSCAALGKELQQLGNKGAEGITIKYEINKFGEETAFFSINIDDASNNNNGKSNNEDANEDQTNNNFSNRATNGIGNISNNKNNFQISILKLHSILKMAKDSIIRPEINTSCFLFLSYPDRMILTRFMNTHLVSDIHRMGFNMKRNCYIQNGPYDSIDQFLQILASSSLLPTATKNSSSTSDNKYATSLEHRNVDNHDDNSNTDATSISINAKSDSKKQLNVILAKYETVAPSSAACINC